MNRRFWKPSLTSQFLICPVPFHLDTYHGCIYNCNYCFARDVTIFSRRNSIHKEFTYLEGNRPDLFARWIERTLKKEKDYSKGEEIALLERIPLKIGANADPFPIIEKKERITYNILQTLHAIDYPVEIQTKNPSILADYDDFQDPNWAIAVTLISTDENFVKACEPHAPSPQHRLDAIKKLTTNGRHVMVKIQPAIYPKILDDLPKLIQAIKDAGCWAFNIEGLKVRISMTKAEQQLFKAISNNVMYDVRKFYSRQQRTGSDWELFNQQKLEYIQLADNLAKQHDLKFFVADNNIGSIGDGAECCGTQVLRTYKILNCSRCDYFNTTTPFSTELERCQINFIRSGEEYKGRIIQDAINKYRKKISSNNKQTTINMFSEKKTTILSFQRAKQEGKPREYEDIVPTIQTPSGGGHLPYVAEKKIDVKGKDFLKKNQYLMGIDGISQTINAEGFGSFGHTGLYKIPNIAQALQTDGQLRDGVSWNTGHPQSYRNIRRLTPIECERLQGFPDRWTEEGIDEHGNAFKISDTQRYKTLGNAVTTTVITEIGKKISKLDESND